MLWSATMPPVMSPVSSWGKKPFGMRLNSSTLRAIVTRSASITSLPWRSAHARVRSYQPMERSRKLRRACRPGAGRRRIQAHIIGVVVSEITIEMAIASDRVAVNSRNSRPTIPPMSRMGMNTATSDTLIETTVNPTSLAPRSAAS
jgi:hypothetical protein